MTHAQTAKIRSEQEQDEKEINKINERLTSKLTHYLSYFNLVEKKRSGM